MFKTWVFVLSTMAAVGGVMLFLSGISNRTANPETSGIYSYTIANLNRSEPLCIQQYVMLAQQRALSCENGGFISSLTNAGIVAANTPEGELTSCPAVSQCSYDSLLFQSDFERSCVGQYECTLRFADYLVVDVAECMAEPARFYVQYQCKMTAENIEQNLKTLRVDGSLALICAGLYVVGALIFERHSIQAKQPFLDKLPQTDQYTLQVTLNDDVWDKVESNYLKERAKISRFLYFNQKLTQYLERRYAVSVAHVFFPWVGGPRPQLAYITFLYPRDRAFLLSQQKAHERLKHTKIYSVQSEDHPAEKLQFKPCHASYQILWENLNVTRE
jgi:hypothetical protein